MRFRDMRHPDRVYRPKALRQMARSCVYAWRRGRRWLYVGRSVQGIARVLTKHHVNIMRRFRPGDRLTTWHCGDAGELARLEMSLIRQHRPEYNVSAKPPLPPTARQAATAVRKAQAVLHTMQIVCAYPKCGIRFIPRTETQKYHNAVCRNAHWQDQHPRQYMAFRYLEP